MDAAAALARTPARLQREEGLLPGPGDRRAHAFPRPGQARAGAVRMRRAARGGTAGHGRGPDARCDRERGHLGWAAPGPRGVRSEEHTSELQSLMRISYAVFCLEKKNNKHLAVKPLRS